MQRLLVFRRKKEWKKDMILYKSLFRGWSEINEQQKENLIKNMRNGITTMSGSKRERYIESKFLRVGGKKNENENDN